MKYEIQEISKNRKWHRFADTPPDPDAIAGVAIDTVDKSTIYGVREPTEDGYSGWYIWAGEYSNAADFFKPIHVRHMKDFFPIVEKYLSLPPGCKFIVDDKGYEDIWAEDN